MLCFFRMLLSSSWVMSEALTKLVLIGFIMLFPVLRLPVQARKERTKIPTDGLCGGDSPQSRTTNEHTTM